MRLPWSQGSWQWYPAYYALTQYASALRAAREADAEGSFDWSALLWPLLSGGRGDG